MDLLEKAPGIFINQSDGAFSLSKKHIEILTSSCSKSPKGRSRICVHKSNDELIHQMLIAMPKNHYVRPHKHINKVESYQVVHGQAAFIHFDDHGNISSVNKLDPMNYFLRPIEDAYHALFILSEYFVFMETTNGPLKEDSSIFAQWAPDENEKEKVDKFLIHLGTSLNQYI